MIKIVVFDLDDTLFSEHDFVQSGFVTVNNWLHTRYTIKGFFEIAWHLFNEGKREKIFNFCAEMFGPMIFINSF